MIKELISEYEKSFNSFKKDLINKIEELDIENRNLNYELEKLEIKNKNLNDEIIELNNKYNKLYSEFGEYKKNYNEESINKLVKDKISVMKLNNKCSLDDIKELILSKSENEDILNNLEEMVIEELENKNSKIYSDMIIRDILNYLYINKKDSILNNILLRGIAFIEENILNSNHTEESAVLVIEILKYYVLIMNKNTALKWLYKYIIDSNILNNLGEQNEAVIVDLLYLALYLEKDDLVFDKVNAIYIIIKSRKYDYLWYELYNNFIIEGEKIYNKFAILKLYYSEMNLIDNRVKQVCLSPFMKNIENIVAKYNENKDKIEIVEEKDLSKRNNEEELIELRNIINNEKNIFKNLKSNKIKKFMRQVKDSNEKNGLKYILKYSSIFKKLDIKEINTILIMSVFYNIHNEFNKIDILNKVFNDNSIESEFIRRVSDEIKIINGVVIEEPLSIFIDKNKLLLKNFDKRVLNKVITVCDEIFLKVSNEIVVTNESKIFCSKEPEILVNRDTYLKLRNKENKIRYILCNIDCCEKCNYKYITNKRLNKIKRENDCEILARVYRVVGIKDNISNNKIQDTININNSKSNLINNNSQDKIRLDIEDKYNNIVKHYINKNNIVVIGLVNSIILDNEKLKLLTRREFITIIICGYISGVSKINITKAMRIYNLGISCDSIFINRLLANKDYLMYWINNLSNIDIDEMVKSVIFDRINNKSFRSITDASKLIKNKVDSKSLSQESQLKKLGYSTTISRETRFKILKEKAIPQLGIAKVKSHIEWLINMNKNKSTMKNSVTEWKYDLKRISRM